MAAAVERSDNHHRGFSASFQQRSSSSHHSHSSVERASTPTKPRSPRKSRTSRGFAPVGRTPRVPPFVWAKFRREVDDFLENDDYLAASEKCRTCLTSGADNEIPLSLSDLCLVLLDYGDIRRKRAKYEDELVADDMYFNLIETISRIRSHQDQRSGVPSLVNNNSSQEANEVPLRWRPPPTDAVFDMFDMLGDADNAGSVSPRLQNNNITPDLIPYKEHVMEAIHAYDRALQFAVISQDSALQVRSYQRFSRLLLDLLYNDKILANELWPNAALRSQEYLEKAIALRPRDDESHCLLGQLFYELHRHEDAKKHLEIAMGLDRESEETLKLLAIVEGFHLHQIKIASRRLRRVINMNGDSDNLYLIAQLLVCHDKLQQAHDVLRSAIAREENEAAEVDDDIDDDEKEDNRNPDVHALFAWICTNAEFFEPRIARKHYKIALSIDKDHLMGNLYLALYYAHIADQYTHAQAHFRLCYNMDKDNDVILFFYGLMQKYQLNNGKRGEKYLADGAVELLKKQEAQQNETTDFHRTNTCFCLSRLDYNNHYHGLSWWSPHQYYRQAKILLQHGKMIESVEVIRRILSLEEHEGARTLLRQLYEAHEKESRHPRAPSHNDVAPPLSASRRQSSDPRLLHSPRYEQKNQEQTGFPPQNPTLSPHRSEPILFSGPPGMQRQRSTSEHAQTHQLSYHPAGGSIAVTFGREHGYPGSPGNGGYAGGITPVSSYGVMPPSPASFVPTPVQPPHDFSLELAARGVGMPPPGQRFSPYNPHYQRR